MSSCWVIPWDHLNMTPSSGDFNDSKFSFVVSRRLVAYKSIAAATVLVSHDDQYDVMS